VRAAALLAAVGCGAAIARAGVVAPQNASDEPGTPAAASFATAPPPIDVVEPDAGVALAFAIFMVAGAIAALVVLRRKGVLARGAFDRSPRRVESLPALPFALAALALFLAPAVGAGVAAGALDASPEEPPSLAFMTLTAGAGYAAALLLTALLWARFSPMADRAGFAARPIDVWFGVGAIGLLFPIVYTVNLASSWVATLLARRGIGEPPSALGHETLVRLVEDSGGPWWWGMIAIVVIGAPLVEEITYRGFLQTSFASVFRSRWLAIGVTSALFTLAHVGAAAWHTLPGLLVVSVAMGVLYERTGRLGACVVAHAVFNALNIALAIGAGPA